VVGKRTENRSVGFDKVAGKEVVVVAIERNRVGQREQSHFWGGGVVETRTIWRIILKKKEEDK